MSSISDDDDDERRMNQLRRSNRYYNYSTNAAPRRNSSNTTATTMRSYHSTPRNEILPLIAAGFVITSGVYTYRALQQMDEDWEEYYEELEEYKAVTGIDPEASAMGDGGDVSTGNASSANSADEDMSLHFKGGTLAIDMGTTHLKLSHRNSLANKSQYKNGKPPSPTVTVDREGYRSTPSLVWMPPSLDDDFLVGRLAAARLYDGKGGTTLRPQEALLSGGVGESVGERAARQAIRDAASNALDQVLGNSAKGGGSSQRPLFVLDESMASGGGSYNVRPIFTYPSSTTGASSNDYVGRYQHAVKGLTSPEGIASFVPEPVAIVAGAEYYNLLPKATSSGGLQSDMVVDVGGTSTCISMVSDGEVVYSVALPVGGDTFVDMLVSHLIQGFYGESNDGDGDSSEIPSSKPSFNDPSALQRLYEASTTAVHELSRKTRSQINIPYLTMDLETRKPKHLEVGMARNVVDAEVEGYIRGSVVPYLNRATTVLSKGLPTPINLSTLLSSAIMASLEQTAHTPQMLRSVLLVGGGGRIPMVREALKQGLGYLAGDAYVSGSGGEKRLIVPEDELVEELCALGAAVWGSSAR